MEVPPNETPESVQSIFSLTTDILSSYGWHIVFFLVVANLIWSHLYPKYRRWREQLEDQQIEAEYKKDPSLIIARDEGMAMARKRMQEKHDILAAEHDAKMKEREEKKRREKLEAMENLLHGKSNSKSKTPQTLGRGDFNPLMGGGGGGSCGYRPPRRGGGGGGG